MLQLSETRTGVLLVSSAVAFAAVAALLSSSPRSPIARPLASAASSRALAWSVPAILAGCAWLAGVTVFRGSQAAARLADGGNPWGWILLACQGGLMAAAGPPLAATFADCRRRLPLGELIRKRFPGREAAAALLLAGVPLLVAARWGLEPTLLESRGRPDLLLPLLPALLAPHLLFAAAAPRLAGAAAAAVGVGVGAAAAGLLVFSLAGPATRYRDRLPLIIPPGEMREAVDWIAARHRAGNGGPTIDVGYDLERGREWIARVGCGHGTSWYTVSRPFDWLLRRRHGLAAAREGSCARSGGGRFRVGYREPGGATPAGTELLELRHIVIRAVAPAETAAPRD